MGGVGSRVILDKTQELSGDVANNERKEKNCRRKS